MKQSIYVAKLPFYTQRMTAENWQAEGFPSLAEAESWCSRGCGIASLRMVLDGFGCGCGRQWDMIAQGLAKGAYRAGVGWIHWGLAHMAEAYGIFGEAKRGKTVSDLQRDLENGFVCIVSITPNFRFGQKKADGSVYGKGGHLVPVYGYMMQDGAITDFLLHHPSMYQEGNRVDWAVPIQTFSDSFSGNYIRLRKAGTIRQATVADALTISRIYAQSWKSAFRGQVPDTYLDRLPENHWVPFFEKHLSNGSLFAKLIYDCQNQTAIGAVAYGAARQELPAGGQIVGKSLDYSAFGEIASLYLLPQYYAKGYGRELLEAVQQECMQTYAGLYLWVLRENERAKAFYQKLGFCPTEEACLCEIDGKQLTDIRYVYHIS